MTATSENVILTTASEAGLLLKIQGSTLRKYCQLLEKAGYRFHKNAQGHRGFFDRDIITLKRVIEASKQRDISLEDAVNLVVSTIDAKDMSITDLQLPAEKPFVTEEKFEEYLMKQDAFQRKLLDRLDKQQRYIEETLKVRDEKLMQSLKEVQDTRRLEAAEANNKKWWKFW